MPRKQNIHGVGLRLAPVFLLALALGACEGDSWQYRPDLQWQQAHTRDAREVGVSWSEFSHEVAFLPGQATLTPGAARQLQHFLNQEQLHIGDEVLLVTQPNLADATHGRLSIQRERTVYRQLAYRQLETFVVPAGPRAGVGGQESVTIIVRRPLAETPYCPDWDRVLATGEMAEEDPGRFGCLNATALGAMVENPNDLVDGRPIGHGDGDSLARGVRRSREGELQDTFFSDTLD